ncbi:MAG: Flp pilus assembly complex ATPase component TadA [Nitrospirae bacterium]|nr:Flp pilus assembly complex ATPase component TadA [Nitrospirota bacterium]
MSENEFQKNGVEFKNKKRLGDFLFDAGLITHDQLNRALNEQKRLGKKLGETLTILRIISDEALAQALSTQLGYPFMDLTTTALEPDIVMAIPESLAKKQCAIPVSLENKTLTVAMVDPLDYECLRDLGFASGFRIQPAIATRKDVLEAIERYYNLNSSVESIVQETAQQYDESLLQIIPEISPVAADAQSLEERSRLAPVIRLANLIMTKAIRQRASDIHIEPASRDFRVRYRIDGLLKEDLRLPKWIHGALISRMKILGKLDIAERRLPQDGSVRVRSDNREIDLRLSTLPTQYGEKMVIRVLDQGRLVVSLDTLGVSSQNLSQIRSLMRRKQGIILVTGPTGSGKTTTLYSMIHAVRDEVTNIVTVEDPIEYNLEGVNQVQINTDIGLTFAHCLRSILRQDPNVILIGEIRDLETAEIACRAAMTGHLVLSTVHTNDAPSTITRLVDLGIPRYLVGSLVMGVIAQRLVRCVCPRCKTIMPPPVESLVSLKIPLDSVKSVSFYYGKGCNYCNYLGYQGRTGLYEVLEMTPRLRELVVAGAAEQDIRSTALASKMTSLGEDGLNKVKEGITTIEELMRVIEVREDLQTFCAQCGQSIHIDFQVCPYCAHLVTHHCHACGKPLQPEWILCPYCRNRVGDVPPPGHSNATQA